MNWLHSKANTVGVASDGVRWRKRIATLGAVLVLASSMPAAAGQHVLPREKMHAAVVAKQQAARENQGEILKTLGRPEARTALSAAGIDFAKVETAVASLDEESASRLAERAREANRDFAAGAFTNETLTYIVIALATAVIILVAVN